jgi:hypothetical protein
VITEPDIYMGLMLAFASVAAALVWLVHRLDGDRLDAIDDRDQAIDDRDQARAELTDARNRIDDLTVLTGRQRLRIHHQRQQICKYLDELDAAARGERIVQQVDMPLGPPVVPGQPAVVQLRPEDLAALEQLDHGLPEGWKR